MGIGRIKHGIGDLSKSIKDNKTTIIAIAATLLLALFVVFGCKKKDNPTPKASVTYTIYSLMPSFQFKWFDNGSWQTQTFSQNSATITAILDPSKNDDERHFVAQLSNTSISQKRDSLSLTETMNGKTKTATYAFSNAIATISVTPSDIE